MARTLLASITLLALIIPTLAQNAVSRALMALPEAKRNGAFKMILDSTDDRCNAVVRTQYNASAGDSDDWEAKCMDGGHYSFSVYSDPNKQIRVLSCRELAAIDKLMQQRAGTKNPPAGCRMN